METSNDRNANVWVDDRLGMLAAPPDWAPDSGKGFARFEQRRAASVKRQQRNARIVAVAAAVILAIVLIPEPRAIAQKVLAPCVNACEAMLARVDMPRGMELYRLHRVYESMRAWMQGASAKSAKTAGAPDFALRDVNGQMVQLSALKGKVVLLNFWATWCGPCKAEIPWFVEFERRYKDRGFAVVGVSMDEDGWAAVRPYVEGHKMNYRVVVGDSPLAQKYGGIDSLPETLVIGRDGTILFRHVGLVSKGDYESEIEKLLER